MENLERDDPLVLVVLREADGSHSTATELAID
jgi:hypothetical protein